MASIEDFSNRINRSRLTKIGDPIVPFPSRITRIGDRDPNTGLWEVLHPNGSVTLNGIKMFNSAVPHGTVVSGIPRADGFIALNYINQRQVTPIIQTGIFPMALIGQSNYELKTLRNSRGENKADRYPVSAQLWAKFPDGGLREVMNLKDNVPLIPMVKFNPIAPSNDPVGIPSYDLEGNGYPELEQIISFTMLTQDSALLEAIVSLRLKTYNTISIDGTRVINQYSSPVDFVYQAIVNPFSGTTTANRLSQLLPFIERGGSSTAGPDRYLEYGWSLDYTGVWADWRVYGRSSPGGNVWGTFNFVGQTSSYSGTIPMPYQAYNEVFGKRTPPQDPDFFIQFQGMIPFGLSTGTITSNNKFYNVLGLGIRQMVQPQKLDYSEFLGRVEDIGGTDFPQMDIVGKFDTPPLLLNDLLGIGFNTSDRVYGIPQDDRDPVDPFDPRFNIGRPIAELYEPEITIPTSLRITPASGNDADKDEVNPLSILSVFGSSMFVRETS